MHINFASYHLETSTKARVKRSSLLLKYLVPVFITGQSWTIHRLHVTSFLPCWRTITKDSSLLLLVHQHGHHVFVRIWISRRDWLQAIYKQLYMWGSHPKSDDSWSDMGIDFHQWDRALYYLQTRINRYCPVSEIKTLTRNMQDTWYLEQQGYPNQGVWVLIDVCELLTDRTGKIQQFSRRASKNPERNCE